MLALLLLLAGGLAVSLAVWPASTRTTTGTTGGGDVYTHAKDAEGCIAQARAFNDYPLVFAGPSVLGYPLTSCSHTMSKTRRLPDGRVWHPGDDFWSFGYGDCTIPEGRESCAIPITIRIDPCARMVDGRIIPEGGQPLRGMIVRGTHADVWDNGISFEQSPQSITIDASGTATNAHTDEQVANAVAVANALVPANGLAEALSQDAPLTAAFAQQADALCESSSGALTPRAGLTTTPPRPSVTPPAARPTATTTP
jgi:hypothetical protein